MSAAAAVRPGGSSGRRRPGARRAATALPATLALALLGACTVPPGGTIALGRTAEGEVVAYVRMCEGFIDGVTVYRPDAEGQPVVARWDADEPVTRDADVVLAGGGEGWVAPTAPQDERLSVYGWTDDASWSADGPDVTLAELSALAPGEVLYWSGDEGPDGGTPVNAVVDLDVFERDACA
ncbi:hypothetical protein J1G42_14795 [Cellulomonas sp. zg-ZUI222]|uniref:hypothetical protein n=1 Tax=Cellulomonas wangleii TaxID=2816956 RepID=UPI001A93EA46|nr:hypothetical protein [Cellulomonas wangleii]MBO0922090.1 hypothetical protein [Cellulomonas wangleii]